MDADAAKKNPAPRGLRRGALTYQGFAIAPRCANLTSSKARQLDDERPPEGGLLNNGCRDQAIEIADLARALRNPT
jgi:hypothetical protein